MVIKNQNLNNYRGEEKLANQNLKKVYENIFGSIASLHGYSHLPLRTIFAAAYTLLQISENPNSNLESIDTFIKTTKISDERALFLLDSIGEFWPEIRKLQFALKTELLIDFIINFDLVDYDKNTYSEYTTPKSIAKLAASILNIKKGDKVIDCCSGIGNFLKECNSINQESKYFGVEIDRYRTEIAKIRLETLGVKHKVLSNQV